MTHLLPPALAWLAQAAPSSPADAPGSYSQSFAATGFVGPLMVLAGAFGLVLAVRRWCELSAERLAPLALQRGLESALGAGEVARGLAEATASGTVLGALVADGLFLRSGGLDEMLAGVERATAREALRLGNRVALLARLGGIVLLFGLLGATMAVMSMLAVVGELEKPTVTDFVRGLGPAFTCVALGILVALFCYVAFFWLDASLTRRTLAARDTAEELMREAAERGSRPS